MYLVTIIKQKETEIIDIYSELFVDESQINDYVINYCEEIAVGQDEPIVYEDHQKTYMSFRDIEDIVYKIYVYSI